MPEETSGQALLRLRFFRDLSPLQRRSIFKNMGSLPGEPLGDLTLAQERYILNAIMTEDRLPELNMEIENA